MKFSNRSRLTSNNENDKKQQTNPRNTHLYFVSGESFLNFKYRQHKDKSMVTHTRYFFISQVL